MKTTFDLIQQRQPQLFSASALRIPESTRLAMIELIGAIESVVALPAYQAQVLARSPAIARLPARARGVFMGYDFHLTEAGPQLIEINTNAGGGLLNAYLLAAHGRVAEAAQVRKAFVDMFRTEWRLERDDSPLRRIAIVDESPAEQFLAAEFELFRDMFEAHGIAAVISDPSDLNEEGGGLTRDGLSIDLIYNRLTDFSLDAVANRSVRQAFENGGVVLTPHPRAHALYADKRNLMLLSDAAALRQLGVDEVTSQRLLHGIPRTVSVVPEDGERLWAERKRWFFKPPSGFGSRAAYRGDKLTRRVFEEILQGAYIAQEVAQPSEHPVRIEGSDSLMKADVRCYVYDGKVQLLAARLYRGQTTNFRTPGGGFAPVFID